MVSVYLRLIFRVGFLYDSDKARRSEQLVGAELNYLMVIAQLMGGLGNQMFQYALGRRLAAQHGTPLKLDLSWFQEQSQRRYCLNYFKKSAETATAEEIARVTRSSLNGFRATLRQSIQRRLPYHLRDVVRERSFAFDPLMFRTRKNVYLIGYWQSEQYFKGIERILREEFTFKSEPDEINGRVAEQIGRVTAVSLHIRRGDYVVDPSIREHLKPCPLEYYERAIQTLLQLVKRPHFFVFSDDQEWAQENLKLMHPVTFVNHNDSDRDFEDLRLMSLCRHHIIANSSFSWWGAWLSSIPDKITIAPRKWFEDRSVNTRDLIPDAWLRL